MCVSCGCGDNSTRHMEGDIVLEDLVTAARNHELDVDQVVENIMALRGERSGAGQADGGRTD